MKFKFMLGTLQGLVDNVGFFDASLNGSELVRKGLNVGGVVVSVSLGRGGNIRHYAFSAVSEGKKRWINDLERGAYLREDDC